MQLNLTQVSGESRRTTLNDHISYLKTEIHWDTFITQLCSGPGLVMKLNIMMKEFKNTVSAYAKL